MERSKSHGVENTLRRRLKMNPPAVCATDINYGLLQLAVLLPLAEGQQTHCSSEERTSLHLSDAVFAHGKIELTSLPQKTVTIRCLSW